MEKLFRQFATMGAMLAFTVWGCWTQLSDSKPLLAGVDGDKLPRIERKMLSPEISPVNERDAFLKKEIEIEAEPDPADGQPIVIEEVAFDPRTVLHVFRLDATILGRNRLAVISGLTYGEGDQIVLEGKPEIECRLEKVLNNSILVRIEDETHEIVYQHYTDNREKTLPRLRHGISLPPSDFEGEGRAGLPSPEQLEQVVGEAQLEDPQTEAESAASSINDPESTLAEP